MTWGRSHVRTTEWVLEELYQTGRQWMSQSARRKRYAPITTPVMARKADGVEGVDDVELALDPEQLPVDSELRERFERLFSEFVERIEGS